MGCGASTAKPPTEGTPVVAVAAESKPTPPAAEPTAEPTPAPSVPDTPAPPAEPAPAAGSATKLRIIHINDVYQLKNFPKLQTLIKEQSEGCANVIVTLAGDFIAPSLLSALDQGAGMIELLNAVGVTHICFGNHEADVPYEALKQRISEFKGVWINSNMPAFEPKLPEHAVLSLKDEAGCADARKVGFLGLLIGGTDRGKNFGANYRDGAFGGAATSIVAVMEAHKAASANLRAAHTDVDCIIPITHQDQKEDEELAATGEYACVLAGHDHDLTITAHGPKETLVIKAGQDAHNAVICDVVWEAGAPRGACPAVTTNVIALKKYDKDPSVAARVHAAEGPVRELESATLSMLPMVTMPKYDKDAPTGAEAIELVEMLPTSKDARFGPCSMAMYLAECLRVCVNAEVALINSGSTRAEAEYESIFTYADLQKECPYPSECIVISLPGSALAEAVLKSRADWMVADGPLEANGALQHDLGCRCDAGNRLIEAAKAPLDEARVYQVLVDSYDLSKDETLKAYAKANPANIPPADAGRPSMTILVEYFCREMWRMLADVDGDGCISDHEIGVLFSACDADNSGSITVEELTAELAKKVGEGASKLVAKQMVALADKDESGTVDREELGTMMKKLAAGMKW